MGDGSTCLGRRIYDPGFGKFSTSSGHRKQEECRKWGQARSEPKPRHIRDYRHKYQKPAGPWNLKDPSRNHIKYGYGITMSPISRHLQGYPPKHSMHPALKDEPPPSFHRRHTEITEMAENPVRLWKPCVDPTLYYGRRKTDATALYRVVPKAHDPNQTAPWYGRLATFITDYSCLDEELDRVEKQRALPKVPQTQLFY